MDKQKTLEYLNNIKKYLRTQHWSAEQEARLNAVYSLCYLVEKANNLAELSLLVEENIILEDNELNKKVFKKLSNSILKKCISSI